MPPARQGPAPHPPEQLPAPSCCPGTARWGAGGAGARPAQQRAELLGAPQDPWPHELTLLFCSLSPPPVLPEQLPGQAACGLSPCPSGGTEPPFRPPPSPALALPEVIIPAFLFLLFCKITLSASPLVSTRLPDIVLGGNVPWGQGGRGAGSPPWVAAELLWGGPRTALGQRQSTGGEPSIGEGPGGQAPAGSLVACGQTPAPRVLICKLTLLTASPHPFLAVVSPSVSGHSSLMQPSGLASAADPVLAKSHPCLPEQPELGHADPTAGKTASGEPPRCLTVFLGAAGGSQQQVRVGIGGILAHGLEPQPSAPP